MFESSVWLHVFARALIVVFIPILLLQLDYTIGEVMLYYFIYCVFDVPLNFLGRWMTRKLGARLVITLGTLATIIFFGFLFALGSDQWWILVVLAFLAAVYDVLYWVAHIYFFMESSKKRENASKDTSLMSIARRLGGLLAPAFGAFVLIFFTKDVLIVLSVIILALSIIPLLMAKGVPDKPKTTQLSAKEFFASRSSIRDYVTMSLYGVHGSAEAVIWPIFIYLAFTSIESVAAIPIIVSVTAILFTYFAGKIHKRDRTKSLIVGGLFIAIAWILRLVIDVPAYYFISVFLVGLFSVFIIIPLDSNIYERGEKRDPLTASMYRNFFSMFSKAVLFGVLALLINVFNVSFIIAAASMLILVVVVTLLRESSTGKAG